VNECGNLGIPTKHAFAPGMNACSACEGDYEDPDRTARTLDADEESAAAQGERFTEPSLYQ
jgi:hypothetical protein